MCAVLVVIGKSSSAEFETPFVDTTNGLSNIEFRGVWAFDRGYDDTTDATPAINRYEAFAVGIDTSNNDNATNGAIYLYDGSKWSRVVSPMSGTNKAFSFNAVAGQEDTSYGSLRALWVVGPDGKASAFRDYYGTLGTSPAQFGPANCPLHGTTPLVSDCISSTETRDFYAIDAVKEYDGAILAGGQEGLVIRSNGGATDQMSLINATNVQSGSVFPSASENITGIRYVSPTLAYITTTADGNDGGKPTSPFKHECKSNPIGRLYKADFTSNANGVWTVVKRMDDNCFYGLTIALTDTATPVVWVATEKGMYRYDGGWTLGTAAVPYYSAVAISQRSGSGVNLLTNNDFESSISSDPSGWVKLGRTGRWGKTSATPDNVDCKANSNEISIPTDTNPTYGKYLRIENKAIYTTGPSTGAPGITCTAPYGDGFTTGVFQTVPFSTIEGQRYKISGDYQVTFASSGIYPVPKKAQGGVAVTCAGSNVQYIPNSIDCSVSNRKLIRTSNNPTTGWTHFEMIVSREDGIFSNINRYGDLRVTKRKMDLQIRCEATYGATVSCDNLKVETLDEPATRQHNSVTVIAAGKDMAVNGIAINEDALNVTNFSAEAIPNKVRLDAASNIKNQVNSMFAVGTQHVYAVGQGYTASNVGSGLAIFNRTPSTLQGTIWAGAYSPISATGNAPTGIISASCIDDRGVNNSEQTLCQRVPESYGMSLEITSAPGSTKTGRLVGAGWFGAPSQGVASTDSLDLGTCQNSLEDTNLNDSTTSYASTQKVVYSVVNPAGNVGAGACDYAPTNDTGSRRCRAVDSNGNLTSALTSVSCLSNFDCLGRCQKDSGFVCLKDDDCKVGVKSTADLSWTTSLFGITPSDRLSCGSTVNGYSSSPLACTPPGWLSFNATDFSSPTPPSGTFAAKYNTLFTSHNTLYSDQLNKGAHELSGWGRFMTLAKNSGTGWVSLRGATIPNSEITGSFLFSCRNCDGGAKDQKNCAYCQDSSNHSCVPSDLKVGPPASQYPQSQCYNVCKGDKSLHCSTDVDCVNTTGVSVGPCVTPGYCSNTPLLEKPRFCQNDNDCGIDTCIIGSVCSTTGAQCAKYGVNLDTTTGKFSGYGWSEDFGWLNFKNLSYGGNRILQTKLGDIYATGQIGDSTVPLPPGGSSCNSTFLITSASSITGFCSASGDLINGLPTKQPNSTAVPFLSAENTYQNVLGRFDLVGIEKDIGGGKNKYGSTLVPLTATTTAPINYISADWLSKMSTNSSNSKYLGGKVYTIGTAGSTTSYRLDQAMNFDNSNSADSGAGILIVNGNLIIGENMTYNGKNISLSNDLRRLASLTIVVKGNLTIENTIENVVGAYYATGTIATATDDIGTNQYPLIVNGLMIAKEFNFKRKFAGTIENPSPSELIIYDGRLQSNPMLGMTDFASALPNSVSTTP